MSTANGDREASLLAKAAACLPGGVLGRHLCALDPPHVLSHGRGAHLFDFNGNEYIDYTCGGGALLLGYDHDGVTEAVGEQMKLASQLVSIANQPAIEFASELCELIPCAEQIRFAGNGAEGTFFALRLARAYTARDKILKFEGAYHGSHDYAMWSYSPSTSPPFPEAVPDTAGMPQSLKQEILIAPYNDLDTTAQIVAAHREQLAAVIVEPAQRQVPPKPGFLEGIKNLCKTHDVVFILDETVTGFRLALAGAQQKYGVVPDLAVYGKTLGGGLPLAAVAGASELMGLCDPRRWRQHEDGVFLSSTLGGNPVACAAGRAFLHALQQPDRYPPFHKRCESLKQGLRDIIQRFDIDAQVLGEGPMWQVVFSAAEIVDYRSSLDCDRERALHFDTGLIKHGIYLRPGGPHYFSMAHDDDDVHATLIAAERVLGEPWG